MAANISIITCMLRSARSIRSDNETLLGAICKKHCMLLQNLTGHVTSVTLSDQPCQKQVHHIAAVQYQPYSRLLETPQVQLELLSQRQWLRLFTCMYSRHAVPI
jgi:hypothetical protein